MDGSPPQRGEDASRLEALWHQLLLPLASVGPFCGFLYFHHRGGTVRLFSLAYRIGGVPALFGVPVVTLSIEKTLYDSLACHQGIDPNFLDKGSPDAPADTAFPRGGHLLPSFSLLPINPDGWFFDERRQSKHSPYFREA